MKNKKLVKSLMLILLIVIGLTWLIPGTITNQETGALELSLLKPQGLLSVFGSFDISAQYFFQNSLIVLFVGIFYGVINKTGAYKELIEKIASKLKKKKELFLVLTIIFFILFTALTNVYFLMFLFVPFFMSILREMGYNKNVLLLSTVGSVLIGFSSQIMNSMFVKTVAAEGNPYLWVKIGVLLIYMALTVLYALKFSKEKEKEEEFFELSKRTGKNINTKPFMLKIVLIVFFIFFLLGFVPWNLPFLSTMHTSIMNLKIGQFAIFGNIFGTFNQFGSWWTSELYTIIISTIILLAFLYKLSFDEFIDGVVEGIKKFMVPAFLVGLMTLVTIFAINSGFVGTILKFIVSSGNAALIALGNMITNPIIADPFYISNYSMTMVLSAINSPNPQQIAYITQVMYGAVMLLIPTSSIMIAGLAFTEKDYKSWFKYIWKFALVLIALAFIAIIITTLIK
ncbi:MAG: hypothetical protein GX032_02745 [Tenericutes bacterium]|nr:hypothetical protein [Mycoplasmatota bacterium]